MNGRIYRISFFLLSISLVGIILIQWYWVRSAINEQEKAFSYSTYQMLNSVVKEIEEGETSKFIAKVLFLKEKDSSLTLKDRQLRELMFVQEDKNTKETFIYKHGILEDDYSLPINALHNAVTLDCVQVKQFLSKEVKKNIIFSNNLVDGGSSKPSVETYEKLSQLPEIEKLMMQQLFKSVGERLPITGRVSATQIQELIHKEMEKRNLHLHFEFAVYNKDVISAVRSKYFDPSVSTEYKTPIFKATSTEFQYELAVVFPKKEGYMYASIIGVAFLSMVFVAIIIGVFAFTIHRMLTHKRISQIKTDFINNITHEFKTPIATTNLVISAIKNPNTLHNPEKILTYIDMLKEENKRMHAQVENILQVSRLEKGELTIEKEPLDVHLLIEMAVNHTQMMLEERNGTIRLHLEAENSDILANESHFTNILINMIENSIKYSPENPEIDIYTENIKNNKILIRIKDKGQGMSKQAVKKVFDKFYREHSGDLHNVKGYGLGLAYVKSIVDKHNGTIFVESEKGKGSTFSIKMSVI